MGQSLAAAARGSVPFPSRRRVSRLPGDARKIDGNARADPSAQRSGQTRRQGEGHISWVAQKKEKAKRLEAERTSGCEMASAETLRSKRPPQFKYRF